jgi:predicted Zn-dependent protease
MKILSFILIAVLLAGCSMKTEKNAQTAKSKEEQALYLQGVVALKKGDPQAAVKMFETVIKIDPDNESAYLLAAKIYLSAKRPQDTVRVLAPALERFPNNGEFPYLLAVAFKEAGYPKQAFVAAKRSIEIYDAWQKKEELKRSQLLMASLIRDIEAGEKTAK